MIFKTEISKIYFNLTTPIYKKKIANSNFYRLYNFHIRKCGGTSLNRVFTSSPDGNEENYFKIANSKEYRIKVNGLPMVGWNLKHIKRGSFWYAFSHHEFDKVFPLKKGTYTFTFLRDPAERVVSHYNMLKDFEKEDSKHPAFELERKWLGDSFTDFINNIPRQHLQNQLFMFNKEFDTKKAFENLKKINFVGILGEDEEEFLKILKNDFDISLDYKHLRKSKYNFIPNQSENKILLKKLSEEYDFFNKTLTYLKK